MQAPMPELRDIHLPEPVSFWPPAPGWWLLTILALGAITLSIILLKRWHRRRLGQRQAKAVLAGINWQDRTWPKQLNGLLKRAAMAYFPLTDVASLHSQQWREFLARQLPAKHRQAFLDDYARLQQQLYRPADNELNSDTYQRWARLWLDKALPAKGGDHV